MGKVRTDDPAKLTDFKLLSFDVYSTLIDEKGGVFKDLQPLLSRLPTPNPYINDRKHTIAAFQKFERDLQTSQPSLRYDELLKQSYKSFAASLGLPAPTDEEVRDFGSGAGKWPAFPDTVAALRTLKERYKLVILSNIDNDSIAATVAGPLAGVEFDAVYTAQNIGSYKPDPRNFAYLVEGVGRELGVEKASVLHTAQALEIDLVPAKRIGLRGAWINRDGQEERWGELKDKLDFTWKFETLGEMAEEVEKAFEAAK